MAIFTPNKTTTTETVNDIINNNKVNQSSTYVFESDTRLENIVKHISGYKWTVNYYHAVTNQNDLHLELDLSASELNYEYNLIKDTILFVDQPLDSVAPSEINGSAYIDIGIIPTTADVFISTLIDGRLGIFTIDKIIREDYNNRYTYKIEYKLYTLIDPNDTTILPKLNKKVISTYYYNKDYLRKDEKVILDQKDIDTRKELNDMLLGLLNILNKQLLTGNTRYLYAIKLDKYGLTYDPYLEALLLRVYDISDINPRFTPIQMSQIEEYNNIFNSIVTGTKTIIDKYANITNAINYNDNPKIYSLMYAGIDTIILTTSTPNNVINIIESNVGYKPIHLDTYLFSNDFYNYLEGKNDSYQLDNAEYCIACIYNGLPIDYNRLKDFYNDLLRMDNTHKYFYLPILGYSIKYTLINNNSVTVL